MDKRFLYLVVLLLWTVAALAQPAEQFVRWEVPKNLSQDEAVRMFLQELKVSGETGHCRLVVFTRDGLDVPTPITLAKMGAENVLTLVSDSTWNGVERDSLLAWSSWIPSQATAVYGFPSATRIFTVRRDPMLPYAGVIFINAGLIVLQQASFGTLAHEAGGHGSRGDFEIYGPWVEGGAEWIEAQLIARRGFPIDKSNSSYLNKVDYELLNRSAVGGPFQGRVLDYALAEVVCTKLDLEKPGFWVAFNTQLYQGQATHARATAIARQFTPTVEGESFDGWFSRQYVFSPTAPVGRQTYQLPRPFFALLHDRQADMSLVPVSGATVAWKLVGHHGESLLSGTTKTNTGGFARFDSSLPVYAGHLRTVVVAGAVVDTAHWYYAPWPNDDPGIYGAVAGFNKGTVRLVNLDDGTTAVAGLFQGGFSFPSFMGSGGRFEAIFSDSTGSEVIRRRFNKASGMGYQVILQPTTPMLAVWPGDTDNDGDVDTADVFPIGPNYGRTGPARNNASLRWRPQPTQSWTPPLATFSDVNGDGIVGSDEILGIGLNYGKQPGALGKAARVVSNSSQGTIQPEPHPATQTPGREDTIRVKVSAVSNLFGVSFDLLYAPTTFLKVLEVKPDAFIGNDVVFFVNIDTVAGKVSVGVSRKSGQGGVFGTGSVVMVRARISSAAPLGSRISLTLPKVTAIDANGASIALTPLASFIQVDTTTAVVEREMTVPVKFSLDQNYPNPFNPETEIQFALPKPTHVTLKVFDVLGHEIVTLAEQRYEAGFHRTRWDGRDQSGQPVPSGVYFYRIEVGNFGQTKKMLLVR